MVKKLTEANQVGFCESDKMCVFSLKCYRACPEDFKRHVFWRGRRSLPLEVTLSVTVGEERGRDCRHIHMQIIRDQILGVIHNLFLHRSRE